ncbi:hypothetical protein DH2020_023579 [Rehmannia glutinosa]|uniref:Myelin-associated oligodendrocyte basic protein n=1 Tax=Rehmannia glutinosa TaxID=99300 RepID=A0ABR0W921_REHGL
MATAPSLLLQEPNLKLKNHLYHSPQFPARTSFANFRIRRSFRKLSVKYFLPNNSSSSNNDSADDRDIKKIGFVKMETKKNPLEIVAKSIINALKALQKPAAAAVLVGLLLMYDPNSALAASGGRVGGSSFSSRSSMSSSRSYTAPRTRAGSGFSYSVPYYAPFPFGGVYVGPAVSVGSSAFLIMIAFAAFVLVSGFLSEGSESSVLTATEKTSVLKLQVCHGGKGRRRPPMKGGLQRLGGGRPPKLQPILYCSCVPLIRRRLDQVGLLGLGRSLQKDLNRIAETADTSTSEGLHYVLTGTQLSSMTFYISTLFNCGVNAATCWEEVVRPKENGELGEELYTDDSEGRLNDIGVDVKKSMEEGEKRFNQLSIEERGKFDEETLVNVNNIKKQSATLQRASGFSNEYIVITILVAAGGAHKLPSINNSKDLTEALQKLASIPSSRTLAVEVLWTPQNEDDTLSERELLEDYPLLRPL